MFAGPPSSSAPWAAIIAIVAVSGCTPTDPVALIPPGERALIQQEAAHDNAAQQQPVSVAAMLARARGEAKPDAIVLHVTDNAGQLSLPAADIQQLAAVGPTQKSAILSIGPSDDSSPVAAALVAPRRAKFLAQYLPSTLQVAETRYDVSLAPNTARLEFGEAQSAH